MELFDYCNPVCAIVGAGRVKEVGHWVAKHGRALPVYGRDHLKAANLRGNSPVAGTRWSDKSRNAWIPAMTIARDGEVGS